MSEEKAPRKPRAKKQAPRTKKQALRPEDTIDGRTKDKPAVLSADGTISAMQDTNDPAVLMPGIRWMCCRLVEAMRNITEGSRHALLHPKASLGTWQAACSTYVDMLLTVSSIMAATNSEHLTERPVGIGSELFNPITGETSGLLIVGIPDSDVCPFSKMMADIDSQETAERMFHRAQMAAVDWLIDHKTGKAEPTKTGIELVKEVAEKLGIKLDKIVEIKEDDEEADKDA